MSTKRDRLIIIFVVLAGILIFAGGVTIAQGQGNIDSGFINSWQATLLSQIHPQTADFAINTQGPNSTYICGSITDVHWTISGSPYIVTCNARLDSGILTIDPGVIIKFLTGTELDIYGTLLAIGLENNLIYFTSDNVTPGPGDWNGMNFYSGSNGSILSYTVVEYGRGITSDSTSIQIEFSTIQYNSPGIYLNSSQSSISHNSIISNTAQSGAGIYIRYGTAIIDSNNISWNSAGTRGGGGIYAYGWSTGDTITVTNNIISHNTVINYGGGGILFDSTNGIISDNMISYNTALYGYGGGIQVSGATGPYIVIQNNSIIHNYANNGGGVWTSNFTTIDRNIIAWNEAETYGGLWYGSNLQGPSDIPVTCNTIINNSGDLTRGNGVYTNVLSPFHQNTFYGNAGYQFENGSSSDQDATQNYWGTTDPIQIELGIYDYDDLPNLGVVSFSPFLMAPDDCAPPSNPTYSISGWVTDAEGYPVGEIEINTNTGNTTLTTSDGRFLVTEIPAGVVQLYPSKAGYTFYPNSLSINLTSDKTGQDFVAYTAVCGGAVGKGESEPNGDMCVAPVAQPFLYLPFDTTYSPEKYLQNWNFGGGINSWFDHNQPTYGTDSAIELFDGIKRSHEQECRDGICGYEGFWYDGHDGLDLIPKGVDYIFPAASGTVLEVCDKARFEQGKCTQNHKLGRYVIISHLDNTYATLYAHLAYIAEGLVVSGTVTRNDYTPPTPIGVIGGSGGDPNDPTPALIENYWKYPHLHFVVFFHGSNISPWVPDRSEVVDSFGWSPWDGHSDDWKSRPSVPLWNNFSPISCIPGSESAVLSVGGITAQFPAGAIPGGQVITLSPTSFSNTVKSALRGLGTSFNLHTFSFPQHTILQDRTVRISSMDFNLPVTVSVNYSGTILSHIDSSHLAIYQFDPSTGEWLQQETTLDPDNYLATALVAPEGYFALQGPLVCPEDISEPADDLPSLNNYVPVNQSDLAFTRWFDIQDDQDWFSIEVNAGITYTIQTQNLALGVDTILTVYQSDGQTIVASDDNSGGGLASLIVFRVPEDGIYFIRVSQAAGSAYGCDSSYQVRITNYQQVAFLPVVEAHR